MSWFSFDNPAAGPEQVRAYSSTLDALHDFHDALAEAAPGPEMLDELAADLRKWTAALAPMSVPEVERLAGRLSSLPVRGHLAIPPFLVDVSTGDRVEGTTTFGSFNMGGGAAAHGGAIMMMFDEVMGVLASAGGRTASRTAFLKTDFRATVPIGTPVRVRAWFEGEEGRKRYINGDMWAGETLCAEATSLFVELRNLS